MRAIVVSAAVVEREGAFLLTRRADVPPAVDGEADELAAAAECRDG